jgi:cytoskeleton protein RodZ
MADTIGLQLKQAREAKNLTIQKVVQATHIRAHYIEAIETNDFDALPSPIHARAFLKLYADYLGISLADAIARQRDGLEGQGSSISLLAPTLNQNPGSENDKDDIQAHNKLLQKQNLLRRIITQIGQFHWGKRETQPIESVNLKQEEPPIELGVFTEPPLQENFTSLLSENTPSQIIFTSIGKTLQQQRESLSLTLDEIERHTHVRIHYLLALEAGEFVRLPSSVQARGMLSNYAHFLNLDVDAILLTFADGLQKQLLERQVLLVKESDKSPSKFSTIKNLKNKIKIPAIVQRYISVDIIVGGGLVVLLLAFAIWGTSRIINMRNGLTPQPTAPPMQIGLNLPTEQTTSTIELITTENESTADVTGLVETLDVTLPVSGNGPVQVVVIAQNEAFVRVTVDGKVQFEGRVTAGTAYPYDGNNQIEVLTGNGRAISILYNQNNLGPMGDVGQVVDHIYTTNAILNPTATFTPTPSITPTPTITPRPTITLRPSITPRPSITTRPSPTPNE